MNKTAYDNPEYLADAIASFNSLTDTQMKKLEKIAKHSSIFRLHLSYINNRILETMYDYGLFVSTSLGDYEWKLKNIKKKDIKKLTLDATLILITEALAATDNRSADYWYKNGVTGRLFSHLVELKAAA